MALASINNSSYGANAPSARMNVEVHSISSSDVTFKCTIEYISNGHVGGSISTTWGGWIVARISNIYAAQEEHNFGTQTFTKSNLAEVETIHSCYVTLPLKSNNGMNWDLEYPFYFYFDFTYDNKSWRNGINTSYASLSDWETFTITYNANGGSGAPSSQTKTIGTSIALSSSIPSRAGHIFQGWAASSNGSVLYQPGATYHADVSVTLYAIWQIITYQITYNANSGSGGPTSQTKTYDVDLVITSSTPTKEGYVFQGWATSATSIAVAYSPGSVYTSNAAITLYAVWVKGYTKPRINNFAVYRCDQNGNADDSGTYVSVKFDYATDLVPTSMEITYQASSGGDYNTEGVVVPPATWSDSSNAYVGNFNQIIGGSLSTENSYEITVTIADGGEGKSTTRTLSIGGAFFLTDELVGGRGYAFGKAAEWNNYVDFNLYTMFRKDMELHPDTKIKIEGWKYKPYYSSGDSIMLSIHTSGYLTSSMKSVNFTIPLSKPIIGHPTATISSGNGFILRQNNDYTHGSASSTYVTPDSYTGHLMTVDNTYETDEDVHEAYAIRIVATFSATTNAVNNSPIGIHWNGTITLTD